MSKLRRRDEKSLCLAAQQGNPILISSFKKKAKVASVRNGVLWSNPCQGILFLVG